MVIRSLFRKRPYCPACGSVQTRYRLRLKDWRCGWCGNNFKDEMQPVKEIIEVDPKTKEEKDLTGKAVNPTAPAAKEMLEDLLNEKKEEVKNV